MRRTLQTAALLFKDHPFKDKIQFVIKPELRENLCCSCDIPHSNFAEVLNEFAQNFPKLDQTTLMQERLTQSAYWHLEDL